MISFYSCRTDSKTCQWHPAGALPYSSAKDIPPAEICWLDMENPTEEEEALVLKAFLPIHVLSMEDINKPRRESGQRIHFPKVEEFPDYLLVIVNPFRSGARLVPGRKRRREKELSEKVQLSALLTRNLLITHHYQPLDSVAFVRGFVELHPPQAARGPDYIFHLILDAMVDEYSPVIDRISKGLDVIESRLFDHPSHALLMRLLRLKRTVVTLRKTLILEREVLARLIRGDFALVDDREIVYYRNVYDHLVRYTELIESAREMVSDLMQSHLAAMSNRLNQIMKVLAMISTVVLPMTLIAGIYGMNFHQGMPELDWAYGYPFALGLMVLSASISLAVFYWRGWF